MTSRCASIVSQRWTWAVCVAFALGVPRAAHAQSPAALTADDYLQIRQLVASYAIALDGGGNAGFAYADLFAPGAEFIRPYTTGRDNLAKLALDQPHGPLYVRHFITNDVIESSGAGVIGKQYLARRRHLGDTRETRLDLPGRALRGSIRKGRSWLALQAARVHTVASRTGCAGGAMTPTAEIRGARGRAVGVE